jgi:FlaA1/EpsC-like NDP-sugar epimerase
MNDSYLITGGTGSFGSNFVDELIKSKKKYQNLSFLAEMNLNNLLWLQSIH